MFKVTWARLYVFGCTHGSDGCARLGGLLPMARVGAWLGRDACAHGRVHGSIATHGLVVHGLKFLWMIEPSG